MEAVAFEILDWASICERFVDEWVVLGDPIWEGAEIAKGVVLLHGPDKRVVCSEAREARQGFRSIAIEFTGKATGIAHSGLLRVVSKR